MSAPPPPTSAELLAAQLPGLRFAVGGIAIALGIAALHHGQELLAPLVLAALLAFALAPAVARLRRWRLPHAAAVALVLASAVALFAAMAVVMGQQLVSLSRDLPSYQETVRDKLRALRPSSDASPLRDTLRLLGVVEGELEAARRALASPPKAATAVQKVQVEAAPPTPLQAIAQVAGPVLLPLAQAGLVLVLVFFMLLQRIEIRDRLLGLLGQDLARSADALNEAGERVSRYLVAQLLVNTAYAVPLALGLWAIGVPGAWLWGLLGGVLRFVPYLGPVIAGAFPLLLAFAVDPGWNMVLQTLALVLVLELVLNNLIEPLAYARSTGVSSLAVLVSAGFWSLVWGPLGLALATPLTVCLVVLGRHLGPLRVLDQLLSSEPVFDAPTRLHQRLISGDLEEALDQAQQAATPEGLITFYDEAGLGALRHQLDPMNAAPSAEHRHRMVSGMARLLAALRQDSPALTEAGPVVLCIGARNEYDSLSAEMLAHALQTQGLHGRALPAAALTADRIGELSLDGVAAVCLCSFSPAPLAHTRFVLRRLRRLRPDPAALPVLLAAWEPGAELDEIDSLQPLGGVQVATGLREALARLRSLPLAATPAPAEDSAPPSLPQALNRCAQRALDVFGMDLATVLLRDASGQMQQASAGLPSVAAHDTRRLLAEGTALAAVLRDNAPLSLPDVARDPVFGAHHPLNGDGMRFFAAAPVRDADSNAVGVLALHATTPRPFGDDDLALLTRMAREAGRLLNPEGGHA